MAQNSGNLQDLFLNQVRKERTIVNVYLANGFQYRGIVKGFDNFVILMETEGKQALIYKHAISSINPSKPINKMLGTEDQPISFV